MQEQFEQNSVIMHDPQQSPPSKLQLGLFVLSLQYPSPTNTLDISSSVVYPIQEQFVQNSVIMHDPQQSPLSKLHSRMFVSSLQYPSPTKFG